MKVYTISLMKAFYLPQEDEYIVIDPIGHIKQWYKVFTSKDGTRQEVLHRLDGPAKIEMDGSETWFKRGYFHRIGGPAVIDAFDDTEEWWIMGIEINSYRKYQRLTKCSDEEILLLKLKWGAIKEL